MTAYDSSSEVTPATTPAYSYSFSDLEGHWAEDIVLSLAEDGIIDGYSDGTFKPDLSISRAELLKVSFEAFDEILPETFGSEVISKQNPFSDINSGDWFYKYVTFGAYHYVVNGYDDGTFRPDQDVTRAEAVKIILLSTGLDLPLKTPYSTFSDVPNDAWYKHFVMILATEIDINGDPLMTGYSDGTFRPGQAITRAEASTLIKTVRDAVGVTMFAADK